MSKIVKLKVLSPTHIGSGQEISPAEYFFYNSNCNILNINSLVEDLQFKPQFEEYLTNTAKHIPVSRYVDVEVLLKHVLYKLPAVGQAVDKLANNAISIKTLIKSSSSAIIPGSSIKGSIMSAMVYHILKENFKKDHKIKSIVVKSLKEANSKRSPQRNSGVWDNRLMMSYVMPRLGTIGANNFTSWLRVSDSNLVDPAKSIEIRCAEIEGAKSKRGQSKLPVMYEAFKAGSEFEVEIDTKNCRFSLEEILDILFEFYNSVYEEDDAGIHYGAWEADEDAVFMRLGQGSTAFSTSMLILANELQINEYAVKPPITRKRIDSIPMGWVEIINE